MARLLTPEMAAGELQVSVSTVRRWIHEGKMPAAVRTPGRGIRIPADTLDALLRPLTPREPEGDAHARSHDAE